MTITILYNRLLLLVLLLLLTKSENINFQFKTDYCKNKTNWETEDNYYLNYKGKCDDYWNKNTNKSLVLEYSLCYNNNHKDNSLNSIRMRRLLRKLSK